MVRHAIASGKHGLITALAPHFPGTLVSHSGYLQTPLRTDAHTRRLPHCGIAARAAAGDRASGSETQTANHCTSGAYVQPEAVEDVEVRAATLSGLLRLAALIVWNQHRGSAGAGSPRVVPRCDQDGVGTAILVVAVPICGQRNYGRVIACCTRHNRPGRLDSLILIHHRIPDRIGDDP